MIASHPSHSTAKWWELRGRVAQEEMQREVARQFALLADDTWHTVDAAQSIEAVEAEVNALSCFLSPFQVDICVCQNMQMS